MTKREAERQEWMFRALATSGVTREDAEKLRRISMTLHRWHELECGTTGWRPEVTISIERDGNELDSKPYRRVQYPTAREYVDCRQPIADREFGARCRLARIMARYPGLKAYVQGDPRGCALYVLRAGDVPAGADADAHYSRGIAVY